MHKRERNEENNKRKEIDIFLFDHVVGEDRVA